MTDKNQVSVNTKNRVEMHPDGYIEIRVVGRQTPETVRAMAKQVTVLVEELRRQGKHVLILDNLMSMSMKQPRSVPKTVAAEAKRISFDKLAMLGSSNRLLRYGTNLMIKAMRMTEKIRYFGDRAEAEKWLRTS